VLAVWMGLYPTPFLRRLESSVNHIVVRVNPQYAAACGGGAPTTASAAGNNAAPFLAALPCGPDGKPLTGGATTPASTGAGADIPAETPAAPR